MSFLFGRWAFDGQPPAPQYLNKVAALFVPYRPDGQNTFAKEGTALLYFSFRTTKEAYDEMQPHVSSSGTVFTWDGRLDNRSELVSDLSAHSLQSAADVAIVAEAYSKWGLSSFAKLIGDWTLSIWDPKGHRLLLAKDFLGSRPLYYSIDRNHITWSTLLDPLVLLSEILGCSDKSDHGSDAGLCPSSGFATINAYEADE